MADGVYGTTSNDSGQPPNELKKKIADQAADASVQAQEDPSRSSLHYGDDHAAQTASRAEEEGTSEPASPDATSPQDTSSNEPAATERNGQSTTSSSSGSGATIAEQTPDARIESPSGDTSQSSFQSSSSDQNSTAEAGGISPQNEDSSASARQSSAEQNNADASPVPQKNSAPSGVSLSSTGVAENAQGTVIGTLDVADADAGDLHSFTLSDDRFEVVDGAVKLKDGVSLDHEEAATVSLEVTATDSAGAQVTSRFEIDVADLNEGPSGVSLSSTGVAENAQGAVIGTLDVADADAGDLHSFTLSDDRFEVVDGAVKLKDGVSLDHEEAATVSLEVTATDSAGAQVTSRFEIDVAEMPDISMGTGFHASYYDVDHALNKLDDIDWDSAPTYQELVGDIDYTNSANSFWDGGSKDTFGAKITGNIEVSESGTFNFHIGGDDGVVLFIDGVEVVDNDGLHGFRTRSGEVDLEPGTHVIEVRYFENYGHAGLKVEWEGPGLDGRELLSAPDTDNLQTVNGMPLSVQLNIEDMEAADGAIHHILEGLPPGTIVQSGTEMGQAGDDGSVDVTGWDTSVVSITPPIEFVGAVGAKLTTEVTIENGDVVSSSMDMSFDVEQAHVEALSVGLQSGFHASYFDVDHSLKTLDDIDWSADPTHEEIVGEVDYTNGTGSFWEGGSTDTFGAKVTGNITVEEGGSYDFFIGGDDGVVLFINGVEVIDNDGLHGFRTRAGEIDLEPGTHEIEVRYFENYGHAGLKLEWEGPDTDGRELVQADPELAVPENGTLDLHLDAGVSDTVSISGLPADTILVSGEHSAVSDGSDIDLSGWNLDFIEFMPPSGFVGEIDAKISISGDAFNGQSVETQHEFTITVGDPDAETYRGADNDEMLMASDGTQQENSNGWSGGDDSEKSEPDYDDDDAMREDVEMAQGSEQSHESFETYERQDW